MARTYRMVTFAHRDSGIATPRLRGRSVAFQNRSSTSAYYVLATELLEPGVPMEILLPMIVPRPARSAARASD